MERDAKYFRVGLFVVITTIALSVFTMWVAGTYDIRSYDRYTIYYTTAVTGLAEGALVRYQGMQVGNVTAIRLSDEQQNLIKVDIKIKEGTPVRGGSVAMLGMTGVTGVAFIDIQTHKNDQSTPRQMDGEEYPVIDGKSSQLAELFKNVPEITQNLLSLSKKLNDAFNDETIARLQNTMVHVENVTRDFNGLLSQQNVANATKVLENAAVASENFSSMSARLDSAATEVERTATNLGEAIARNEENFTRFTREGVDQVIRLTEESRKTAGSIRTLSDKLGEDPSKVIYQPNYHGVEIPK